jgi:MFS family permease
MARKYLGGSGERLTVWISIAASTVLVFYGYDQGVFGNVIINENFLHTFGYPSANMQGVMTSIYNIGCFIGAMSTIWTGDKLGRPRQIMLGSTVIGVGAIVQTCSWTVGSMMVGRIVAGLGTGMNTATAGVWQAETSKMNSRGKLVIIQMGMSKAFACLFENTSLISSSQLHHWLQYLQLAHTRLLVRTSRCRMALPACIPALLHVLHICHVPLLA